MSVSVGAYATFSAHFRVLTASAGLSGVVGTYLIEFIVGNHHEVGHLYLAHNFTNVYL
jgi:hypothetical protein